MVGVNSLPEGNARLELFVRSSVPAAARESQSTVRERLRALEADGNVDGASVRTWEKRIPVDAGVAERETSNTYAEFDAWARRRGVSLSPFFDTRDCHSSITGESHTALVLPVMSLAVYEGDRLSAVFPHADEDRAYTVGEALDALDDDGGESDENATRERVSAGAP
ncbi:HTH domain-containing protein [Halococcus sp. AFM35]|uniref:HTH domain-containing protein n=1 Tax=Halococcus sp. AFM35 TaxID=3421653 RepID=UPI003EBF756E